MAAKVTPVRFSPGSKDKGAHKVAKFNLFEQEDMDKYSELRTLANDHSSGIKIEQIREYARKTVTREGAGEDLVVTTTDEIYLVVHYWENKPKNKKGDSTDDLKEAKKDFSLEREAQAD